MKHEAVRDCLGTCAERFLAVNILLANVGTVAVYLQIAGERLAKALIFWGVHGFLMQRVLITSICGAIVLPFTFPAKLGPTKWPSVFSCIVAVIAIAAIISVSTESEVDFAPVVDAGSLLQGVPISCYAFSAMSAVFPVYAELPLPRRSSYTIAWAMATAVCLSGAVYMVIGIVASKRFGSATLPDILANFEASNPSLFHYLGSLYAVACLLGIPVMLFPSRRSLNYLIFRGEDRIERWMWACESTLLILCACALAALSGSILVLLDLIGSVSAIAVDNVLPGVMFIRAQSQRDTSCVACDARGGYSSEGFQRSWPPLHQRTKRAGIVCMLVVGLFSGIVSSGHSLATAFLH